MNSETKFSSKSGKNILISSEKLKNFNPNLPHIARSFSKIEKVKSKEINLKKVNIYKKFISDIFDDKYLAENQFEIENFNKKQCKKN